MQASKRRMLRHIGGVAATLATTFVAPLSLLAAGSAQAQAGGYPSGPLRIIIPVGPGSGADTMARFVGDRVSKLLGQPVVVESRPGADHVLAVQALLSAPPDGHTLLLTSATSLVFNPILNKSLPYDARDIRSLVISAQNMTVFVTGASSRFKTLAELIAAARKDPGTVSFAYYGQNYRVGGLMLQDLARIKLNEIPYKGASQVTTDLVGGVLDSTVIDVGSVLPLVKSGKLRALAVTGTSRHPDLPDVPTVQESGVPDYELGIWTGFGVHARTPEPIVQVLEAALHKVMAQPDFQAYAAQNGNMQVLNTPGKEVAVRLAADSARYKKLLEAAGTR